MTTEYETEGNVVRLKVPAGSAVQVSPPEFLDLLQKISDRMEVISREQDRYGHLLKQIHATSVSASSIAPSALMYGGVTYYTPSDLLRGDGGYTTIAEDVTQQGMVNSIPLISPETAIIFDHAVVDDSHARFAQPDASKLATGVPVYRLLTVGALLTAILSAGSTVLWLLADAPILHPAAGMLTLLASPFLYLMGCAARRQLSE